MMSGSHEVRRVISKEGVDTKPIGDHPENNKLKRKRSHRHTQQQIQAMEDIFRDCPHPDNKQRIEIGRELGMDLLQVKFWFQNKRTQMKSKHERHQNTNLRSENEKLRAENGMLREALSNASCQSCGRMAALEDVSLDERHLRTENARLKDEINRISGVAANYVGKPLTNFDANPFSHVQSATDLGYYDDELKNITP